LLESQKEKDSRKKEKKNRRSRKTKVPTEREELDTSQKKKKKERRTTPGATPKSFWKEIREAGGGEASDKKRELWALLWPEINANESFILCTIRGGRRTLGEERRKASRAGAGKEARGWLTRGRLTGAVCKSLYRSSTWNEHMIRGTGPPTPH